jgi:hypothetical protein
MSVFSSLKSLVYKLIGPWLSLNNQYRLMHWRKAFKGKTYRKYLEEFDQVFEGNRNQITLDFGCGKVGGLANVSANVIPYDPCIKKYTFDPWIKKFDIVFSADVLEHLEETQIDQFLENCDASTADKLFLAISCRAAEKLLPDGRNVHLTVKPPAQWESHLQQKLPNFQQVYSNYHESDAALVVGLKRIGSS